MENLYYADKITNYTYNKTDEHLNDGPTLIANAARVPIRERKICKIDSENIIERCGDMVCDFIFITSKNITLSNLKVKLVIGNAEYETDNYRINFCRGYNEITFPSINNPIPLISLQYNHVCIIPNFIHEKIYAEYIYLCVDLKRHLAQNSWLFGNESRFVCKRGLCSLNENIKIKDAKKMDVKFTNNLFIVKNLYI